MQEEKEEFGQLILGSAVVRKSRYPPKPAWDQILRLGFLVIRDLPSPMVTLGRAGTDKLSSHEDKSTTQDKASKLFAALLFQVTFGQRLPLNTLVLLLQWLWTFYQPETAPAIKTKLVVRQYITGNGT